MQIHGLHIAPEARQTVMLTTPGGAVRPIAQQAGVWSETFRVWKHCRPWRRRRVPSWGTAILATHLYRSDLPSRRGATQAGAKSRAELCAAAGVKARIVPAYRPIVCRPSSLTKLPGPCRVRSTSATGRRAKCGAGVFDFRGREGSRVPLRAVAECHRPRRAGVIFASSNPFHQHRPPDLAGSGPFAECAAGGRRPPVARDPHRSLTPASHVSDPSAFRLPERFPGPPV